MVQIDLGQVSVRDANEKIRDWGAKGEDIEVLNPDARHHIGVGLIHPVRVHVRGSAGYFCAGLADKARFEIDNNAGWGLGDNMYAGTVTVRGNAGAIAGVAIRGVEIVVHGNVGSRCGPGDEGGDALLRRQRQLHGRLHDVRRAHHHPGRIRRACGRGHGGRRYLCRRRGALPRLRRAADRYRGGRGRRHPRVPGPSRNRVQGRLPKDRERRQASALRDQRAAGAQHSLLHLLGRVGLLEPESAGGRLRQGPDRPLPGAGLWRRAHVAAPLRPRLQARPLGRGHGRRPGDGGGNADRDRGSERSEGAQALHAGDGRADELRRALALDQAGGGHGVEHGGDRREHRRRRHERRPAGRGGAACLPVPGRKTRLEHPRHEPGGRA